MLNRLRRSLALPYSQISDQRISEIKAVDGNLKDGYKKHAGTLIDMLNDVIDNHPRDTGEFQDLRNALLNDADKINDASDALMRKYFKQDSQSGKWTERQKPRCMSDAKWTYLKYAALVICTLTAGILLSLALSPGLGLGIAYGILKTSGLAALIKTAPTTLALGTLGGLAAGWGIGKMNMFQHTPRTVAKQQFELLHPKITLSS